MSMAACDGEAFMERLPNEILAIVFSFLDGRSIGKAHGVCRRWNDILFSMSSESHIWFNCCMSEIPRLTLLHLCNHPIERCHSTGLEWKAAYVQWCTCRGSRLLRDGAKLMLKKNVDKLPGDTETPGSPGSSKIGIVCYTDDLVFVLEKALLVVYDMHSDASMREELPNFNETYMYSYKSTVAMTTLGIRLPVNERGKTDFQIAVERVPLVVVRGRCSMDVFVGLRNVCSVPLTSMFPKEPSVCAWYNIIVLPFTYHDVEPKLHVYTLDVDSTVEPREYKLRPRFEYSHQNATEHSPYYFSEATVIGNVILTLDDDFLLVWDTYSGKIVTGINQPFGYRSYYASKRDFALSWVGNTVAATRPNVKNVVVLFHLDECADLITKIRVLQHGIVPRSIRMLYDDSLWMIHGHLSELWFRTGKLSTDYRKSTETRCATHDRDGQIISGTCQKDPMEELVMPDVTNSHEGRGRENAKAAKRRRIKEELSNGLMSKGEKTEEEAKGVGCFKQEEQGDDKKYDQEDCGDITANEITAPPSSSSSSSSFLLCSPSPSSSPSSSLTAPVRDDYKQNLSALLGISEESPLWEDYIGKATPGNAQCQDSREISGQYPVVMNDKPNEFVVDDDDDNSRDDDDDDDSGRVDDDDDDKDDEEDGDEDDEDEDEDNIVPFLFGHGICNAWDSTDDEDMNDTEYLGDILRRKRVRWYPLPSLFFEQTNIVPLSFTVPHQGCAMIDWKFHFRDWMCGMETKCYSPCRARILIYKWHF